MKIEEMLANAAKCEWMADKAPDEVCAFFLHQAAQQWIDMAVEAALLERERTYRIIHNWFKE
jgi:hypothetical protein